MITYTVGLSHRSGSQSEVWSQQTVVEGLDRMHGVLNANDVSEKNGQRTEMGESVERDEGRHE